MLSDVRRMLLFKEGKLEVIKLLFSGIQYVLKNLSEKELRPTLIIWLLFDSQIQFMSLTITKPAFIVLKAYYCVFYEFFKYIYLLLQWLHFVQTIMKCTSIDWLKTNGKRCMFFKRYSASVLPLFLIVIKFNSMLYYIFWM